MKRFFSCLIFGLILIAHGLAIAESTSQQPRPIQPPVTGPQDESPKPIPSRDGTPQPPPEKPGDS